MRQELSEPLRHETAQFLRQAHPLLFGDPESAQVIDSLVEKNLQEELEERRGFILETLSKTEPPSVEEVRQEVRYVLNESVRYWVEHWAMEEIAGELEAREEQKRAGG